MNYEKQNFIKGQILKAEHLNHMEEGIAALDTGKLNASALPEAVNTALAQAKVSGEFDGEKGDPGSDATVTAASIKSALGYTPANADALFDESELPLFKNLLDEAPLEYGRILNTNGTISDTATAACVTGYIPVVMGQIIRMKDIAIYASGSPRVCLYDENYTFITMIGQDLFAAGGNYFIGNVVQDANGNFVQFTVLKNSAVRFIKIGTNTITVGKNPVITVDEEIKYEMGYGLKINSAVRMDYAQIVNAPQKNGWSILPYE